MKSRVICVAALGSLVCRAALAAPSPADAARAQGFARQGVALEQHGDLAAAEDALAQAFAFEPTPSAAVALAKLRVKLGLLIDARDVLTPLSDPAPPGEPPRASAARTEAKQMLSGLLSRIPRVHITIDAPDLHEPVAMTMDGQALAAGTPQVPVSVNPGHHVLVASAAGRQPRTVEFDASESAETTVEVSLPAPAPPPPPPPPVVKPPPPTGSDERMESARRAKFSVGRFFLESLGSAVVGSLAAYGTFKATCGNDACLGGGLAALGVNLAVTPLTVWILGNATGGDGGLGWTFLGGIVAFSGYAGPSDPTLPLVVGVILMPFTSAAVYELSSNANAARVLGPSGSLVPTFTPLFGPSNAVIGWAGGLGGRF